MFSKHNAVKGNVEFYLSKACGVDRLCVLLLREVEVVHIQSAPGNTHSFSYLIVLLQPANKDWIHFFYHYIK